MLLKGLQRYREIVILVAILFLFCGLELLEGEHFSLQTVVAIFNSAQILILLSIGACLVMLTRNIDVSVGSTMGLCAVIIGMLLNDGHSLPVAMLVTLISGGAAGFFNGMLVSWLRIPAIVATLGTLGLYRGVMLLLTGGKWIENLPDSLKTLSAPILMGISSIGWCVIVLVFGISYFLRQAQLGRDFYATGDNLHGAQQLGVRVNSIRIAAFTLNGVMAALAGIAFAAQIGFIPNQTGNGLEMKAIAASVLGGVSLLGGAGSAVGAVLGALFLVQIDTALVLLRLPAWWNSFIAGLILVMVLLFDGRLRLMIEKKIRQQKYAKFTRSDPAKNNKVSKDITKGESV